MVTAPKWASSGSVVDHLGRVITFKTAHSSRPYYPVPKSVLHLVSFGDEVMQSELEQRSTLGNPSVETSGSLGGDHP